MVTPRCTVQVRQPYAAACLPCTPAFAIVLSVLTGFQGRAEIARQLIKHGLDPFDIHKDGYAPMQRACWGRESRHAETVEVFIESLKELKDTAAMKKALKACMGATSNSATSRLLKTALNDAIKDEV